MAEPCRCGHTGEGPHPCHGLGYTCREPATAHFICAPTCLAGAQMKLGAYETWACDPCWERYRALVRGEEVPRG